MRDFAFGLTIVFKISNVSGVIRSLIKLNKLSSESLGTYNDRFIYLLSIFPSTSLPSKLQFILNSSGESKRKVNPKQ